VTGDRAPKPVDLVAGVMGVEKASPQQLAKVEHSFEYVDGGV
jgi:hypothetical protein